MSAAAILNSWSIFYFLLLLDFFRQRLTRRHFFLNLYTNFGLCFGKVRNNIFSAPWFRRQKDSGGTMIFSTSSASPSAWLLHFFKFLDESKYMTQRQGILSIVQTLENSWISWNFLKFWKILEFFGSSWIFWKFLNFLKTLELLEDSWIA